ncbi:MAG: hypothetical protein MUO53_13435 [Maribacter sp.]|nr:hypothetical protein [Maribacter sp.]
MISCDEATLICNKSQYKEATIIEKMKLRFHVLYCSACAGFIKKNTELTSLCTKANLRTLTSAEKMAMKQELQKQI